VITIDCRGVNSEAEFWNAYLVASRPDGAGYFGCKMSAILRT